MKGVTMLPEMISIGIQKEKEKMKLQTFSFFFFFSIFGPLWRWKIEHARRTQRSKWAPKVVNIFSIARFYFPSVLETVTKCCKHRKHFLHSIALYASSANSAILFCKCERDALEASIASDVQLAYGGWWCEVDEWCARSWMTTAPTSN